ncbi:glycosyltransferase family 4 protein [Cyclobacterium lianum]|uniref:glycosyltransferase family 4 protein n=1 Tax=Cyclobacterium lianum TaxID=388280 RepID=UPI000933892C|nr:glycosyltransferase family 4 protein [Cyclobacterium lianum]
MPKRILFLPKYTRKGASSRLRTYQFLPLWSHKKVQLTISPFFTDTYLEHIYAGKKPPYLHVLSCYWRRLLVLLTAGRYDLVIIEKELFPYLPAFPEWLLCRLKGYWVDYDDAVFHNYDQGKYAVISRLMPRKIDRVMKWADLVTAGNEYLICRARSAGAKNIVPMPTVIDPLRYRKKVHKNKATVTIGWIGSPSTLKYLDAVIPALETLHKKYKIMVLLINGKNHPQFSGNLKTIPWTEAGEVDALLQIDIGIMPLPDNPWERGKCSYKLIQYMACGLPVVASPVGMNREVVQHVVNGFLANTQEEWVEFLGQLISDWKMREDFGTKGYELVMGKYTLAANFERMLHSVKI